jgi:hypothetical protein
MRWRFRDLFTMPLTMYSKEHTQFTTAPYFKFNFLFSYIHKQNEAEKRIYYVWSENLKVITMKSNLFWYGIKGSLVEAYWQFRIYCPYLHAATSTLCLLNTGCTLWHWMWRQDVLLKCQWTYTRLYGATSQKTISSQKFVNFIIKHAEFNSIQSEQFYINCIGYSHFYRHCLHYILYRDCESKTCAGNESKVWHLECKQPINDNSDVTRN